MVAAEGEHGEGVVAQRADLGVQGGGSDLGGHGGANEHAVGVLVLLGHQRHVRGAAAAEENRVNRDARRGLPVRTDDRALGFFKKGFRCLSFG